MRKILFAFLLFNFALAYGQKYVKTTFDIAHQHDGAFSVERASNNRYLLSGNTSGYFYVFTSAVSMQVDSVGSLLDMNVIGDSSSPYPKNFIDYIEFGNNFYLTGAFSDSLTNEYNTKILIKDSAGNVLFDRRYDFGYGESSRFLFPNSKDSTLLLLGYHYVDTGLNSTAMYLAQLDRMGNLLRYKEFGTPGYDFGIHLIQMDDGSIALCGYTSYFAYPNNVDNDIFLMKLDADWNQLWVKYYGNSNFYQQAGWKRSMVMAPDSGFLIIGRTYLNAPFYDAAGYVIKTDKHGNKEWEKVYDKGNSDDWFQSILPAGNGNYFIAGGRFRYEPQNINQGPKGWMIKIDSMGNVLWERIYLYYDDFFEDVYINDMTLNPHGVAITGYVIHNPSPTKNDIILITTDSCGYTEGDVSIAQIQLDTLIDKTITLHNASPVYCSWQWQFGDGDSSSLRNPTHTYSAPGSYTISLVTRAGNDWDTAYLHVNIADTSTTTGQQSTVVKAQMRLYPNPASSYIMLSGYIPENETGARVEFYDMQGRLVKTELLKNGLINQGISTKGFATGVYAYRARSDKTNITSGRIFIEP